MTVLFFVSLSRKTRYALLEWMDLFFRNWNRRELLILDSRKHIYGLLPPWVLEDAVRNGITKRPSHNKTCLAIHIFNSINTSNLFRNPFRFLADQWAEYRTFRFQSPVEADRQFCAEQLQVESAGKHFV